MVTLFTSITEHLSLRGARHGAHAKMTGVSPTFHSQISTPDHPLRQSLHEFGVLLFKMKWKGPEDPDWLGWKKKFFFPRWPKKTKMGQKTKPSKPGLQLPCLFWNVKKVSWRCFEGKMGSGWVSWSRVAHKSFIPKQA